MKDRIVNLALAGASIILFWIVVEAFFHFAPGLIPQQILLTMSSQKVARAYGNDPNELVERLESAPWIKFKPGVTVHDAVRPGEMSTFVGTWVTDERGFKNGHALLSGLKIRAVIVGDSHVEGVGVAPDESTAAILTTKFGIPTYNLGVQGYGPQQALGAFAQFGVPLEPEFAFLVVNGSTFLRATALEKGEFTGRIAARLDEVRRRNTLINNLFLVGALRVIKRRIMGSGPREAIEIPEGDRVPRAALRAYLRAYVARYLDRGDFDLSDSAVAIRAEAMQINNQVIEEFVHVARTHGIRPYVVILPTVRYLVEAAYPEDFAARMEGTFTGMEYEANATVIEYCERHEIPYIDTTPALRELLQSRFVSDHSDSASFLDLPFFKVDGHPSQVAHELYAQVIAEAVGDGAP